MSIATLVVDDEPIARRAVVRLLRDDPDIELLGECGDGASAVEAIRSQSPDLVFLDIQMPAINGMDVVATIGAERMPMTVFRSAYNGAKHFLNAVTWNLREELRESHPGIVVSLVSPPVVATEFGVNALHGGPDSRSLPFPQDVTEVGEVIAWVIAEKKLDVYTRPGSKARITAFLSGLGEDPPASVIAGQRVNA